MVLSCKVENVQEDLDFFKFQKGSKKVQMGSEGYKEVEVYSKRYIKVKKGSRRLGLYLKIRPRF